MISTAKNKTYYMWLFRSRLFGETKETKIISGLLIFRGKKQNFAEFSGANSQEAGKSADFVREKSKFAEKSNFEGFSGANS